MKVLRHTCGWIDLAWPSAAAGIIGVVTYYREGSHAAKRTFCGRRPTVQLRCQPHNNIEACFVPCRVRCRSMLRSSSLTSKRRSITQVGECETTLMRNGMWLRSCKLGEPQIDPITTFVTIQWRRRRTIAPGQPGHEFKPEAQPLCGEAVLVKRTNNAFIGTDLEVRLHTAQQTLLVVAGVITNNSVEATVRMAGNLGFDTFLVEDGCFTFARKDWNGQLRTASEVHAMSLANLDGEYCSVTRTAEVLAACAVAVP
jgi:hypothetical protein